ncbi:MAG: hypothetical protein K2X32_06330, partial [Phycisphaerales bacterium]|nr:hypothetical protein [Phycisphaerales bacterium]
MNHRFLSSSLLALALCLGAPAISLGQTFPQGAAQKSELSATDKTQISQWLAVHTPRLSVEDPRDIKAAREAILQPLRAGQGVTISVSFRKEMQENLAATLSTLADDKREIVAVNALRIAGEIGHASLVPTMTKALKDKRPGVQYAALYGYRATFDAAKTAPAITATNVGQMLIELRNIGTTTADPRILDGVILAIESCAANTEVGIVGARDLAITELSKVVQAQSRLIGASDKPDEMLQCMLRAATVAQSTLTAAVGKTLPPGVYLDLIGVSGDLISLSAHLKSRSVGNTETMETLLRAA